MYTGRTFIRETAYICGAFADLAIYPVFQQPGKRRAKSKPTKEIQERLNQRNAEKKLVRLVHQNFSEKDIALHVTYREGEEPGNEEEAQKDIRNFLRRVRRAYQKLKTELKYIYCTELGEQNGRAHHHIILSGGLDRDTLEEMWGKGYANSKRLQMEDNGAEGLARYMAKSHKYYRRWCGSRNLVQPEPEIHDGRISVEEERELPEDPDEIYRMVEEQYPEFEITMIGADKNLINKGVYIEIEMRRRKQNGKKGLPVS